MKTLPRKVVIEEQGLRDGLQNEDKPVPTERKLALIRDLLDAGVRRIQVTSFVHPGKVPQMADAERLCARLPRVENAVYSALVLNVKGLFRAAEAGLSHITASISASDTHSRRNAGLSWRDARAHLAAMVKTGKSHGLTVRGGIQCAFGCRFEGLIPLARVLDMAAEQFDLQVDEIELADTTGMGHPGAVETLAGRIQEMAGGKPVYLHLHDTEGKALANALAALRAGVTHFDTAFGGMGGCPFVPGASGNLATEDLVLMLEQMGVETGIEVAKVAALSRTMETFLGKRFSGKVHYLLGREGIEILARPATRV